jgi:hypothetical protein
MYPHPVQQLKKKKQSAEVVPIGKKGRISTHSQQQDEI